MLRSSLAGLQPASLMVLLLFIVTGPGLAEERTFDYRYDRLGRLVVASDGITQIDDVYEHDDGFCVDR